ncbi:MAG TPA: carboxypeptidase regulatory-like domain-containing protein [Candidatus Binatus sp.]|nr:carboxypeptidase regulatory-like domain-containing protein [Candidatus Binatus sp.]
MKKLVRFWAAWAFILLFAMVAAAQDSGRLDGEIMDKEGKPYPDVTVMIKNPDTGQTYTVKTDKNGKFVQLGLRNAIYAITLTNQKEALNYGPVKFQVDVTKDNNFKLNFKDIVAETAAAHPEEVKKKEEEEDKFKAMKAHFQNGLAAMTEATDLQKQARTAAAEQKVPLQEKRVTDCQTAVTEFQQAEQGVGPKEVANHATVLQDLGAAYECVGRYDDAAGAFQKAVDLKPQASAYSGLATNLANSAAAQTDPKAAESKLADATADCDKSLALDPAVGATCYKNLGIVLNNKGRQKDAVAPLQKATQANPKDAQAWYLMGSALTAMMDCKQEGEKMTCTLAPGTQEAYQKCIDIDPNSALGKECKENLDGAIAAAGGTDTTVSKKKKKS